MIFNINSTRGHTGSLLVSYYGNPKIYGVTLCLACVILTQIKANCVAHNVVTPFGVAGRDKASREIACIRHSVLLEPK